MKPEGKVRGEDPEPLICHRAVGSLTIDTGKILGVLWGGTFGPCINSHPN